MKYVALGFFLVLAAAAQSAPYSIVGLDGLSGTPGQSSSYAYGISPNGLVVGAASSVGNEAIFWNQSATPTSLGTLPGGFISQARAANGAGQIAGYSGATGGARATLYTPGTGVESLGTLPGMKFSVGRAINEAGQVVGYSGPENGLMNGEQAFRWSRETGMVRLAAPSPFGSTSAFGINDRGQAVGQQLGNRDAACFWDVDGSVTTFGGVGFCGLDINNAEQAVGYGRFGTGFDPQAFFWTKAGGVQSLGLLSGYQTSIAYSINDRGVVVGSVGKDPAFNERAFIWTAETGMIDLNSLIDPTSGFVLTSATGINDAGQIVGYGRQNGYPYRSFILTPNPVPEPASLAALSLGAFGFLRRRRAKAGRSRK